LAKSAFTMTCPVLVKIRLALSTGADAAVDFADGVWPRLVASTGRGTQMLTRYLA